MFDIVLVEPQIAVNTGAIIRLSANAGARLHLVGALGFSLDSTALKRGGLDYHDLTDTRQWESWAACRAELGTDRRWLAATSRARHRYDLVEYVATDVLVFGCESDGLPEPVLAEIADEDQIMIPMRPGNRSINLANAVSIVVYEAFRQLDFPGTGPGSFEAL
jgi:tRNA (cytidine/uridine-2'-O-)-methyltransferase